MSFKWALKAYLENAAQLQGRNSVISSCSLLIIWLLLQKKSPRESDKHMSSSSGIPSPSSFAAPNPKHEWKVIASAKKSRK